MDYKSKYKFESRLQESRNIREKFPGRVPVIIQKATRTNNDIPIIDKNKFLVPLDLSVGQFIYVIRKRLSLPPEKAIFIFVNNSLPSTSMSLRELYNIYTDEDGFLYMEYCGEATFG
jgi:GABA(A) receptor-associated protein